MLIYVSGAYRAKTSQEIENNVKTAEDLSLQLIKETTHYPICPHTMTRGWEETISVEDILRCDFLLVKKCDSILMVPGWKNSEGACLERRYAKMLGKSVYYSIDEIPKNSYPQQFNEFDNLLQKMSNLHRNKNIDYSAQNISATGELGLVTRLLDKMARLLSLLGWKVKMTFESKVDSTNENYESVEDTLLDTAVYALIQIIFRKGKWGK